MNIETKEKIQLTYTMLSTATAFFHRTARLCSLPPAVTSAEDKRKKLRLIRMDMSSLNLGKKER